MFGTEGGGNAVQKWFRCNVWHPAWGKRDPKMVPLNRSGYAVSPFSGRPKRDPKMVPLNRPGHAVPVWWPSVWRSA